MIASVIRKSFSPGWAVLSRRIRSSDSPSVPQGTKCRMARSTPFSVAVISTQSPSPGPPMRPSAMEKPRSVELPRQESVTLMTRSSSARGMSPTRRISATYPALATRFTICRTLRIERPDRLNSATFTIASSPSSRAVRSPSRHHTSAPSSLHPMTAGRQACRAATVRNSAMAPGHASGSPIGSPDASITPDTTR